MATLAKLRALDGAKERGGRLPMTTKKSNTNLKLTPAKLADSIIKEKTKPESVRSIAAEHLPSKQGVRVQIPSDASKTKPETQTWALLDVKPMCEFCWKEAVSLGCYKHAKIRREMYEKDGYKEGRAAGRAEVLAALEENIIRWNKLENW